MIDQFPDLRGVGVRTFCTALWFLTVRGYVELKVNENVCLGEGLPSRLSPMAV